MPTPGRRPEAGTSELSRAPSDITPVESLDLVEAMDPEAILGLVDAAPDGIVMADERGRILFANRRTEELFGYGRAASCSDARSTTCCPSRCGRCTARTGRATGPSLACVRWARG